MGGGLYANLGEGCSCHIFFIEKGTCVLFNLVVINKALLFYDVIS